MRAFLAIPIPTETLAEFSTLQLKLQSIEPNLAWTRAGNLHLTLLFLGERSGEEIRGIIKTLDKLAWPQAFNLSLDKLGLFGSIKRPKVLWLGPREGEQVSQLALLVRRELGEAEDFVAHITLARFRGSAAGGFATLLGSRDQSITLPVERVVLYESKLAAGPVRYIPRATWKLEGAEL